MTYAKRITRSTCVASCAALPTEYNYEQRSLIEKVFKQVLTRPIDEHEITEATHDSLHLAYTLTAENPQDWATMILNKVKTGVDPRTLEGFFQTQLDHIQTISSR